jgi:hypothetical protein
MQLVQSIRVCVGFLSVGFLSTASGGAICGAETLQEVTQVTSQGNPRKEPPNVESFRTVTLENLKFEEWGNPGTESEVSGLVYGPGSGLAFLGANGDSLQFYFVTDRGPNFDPPKSVFSRGFDLRSNEINKSNKANQTEKAKKDAAKVFPMPTFGPQFGILQWDLDSNRSWIVSSSSIREAGHSLSGLPRPSTSEGATGELALDLDFNPLPLDPSGIDPEAVTSNGKGSLFVAEEYGPSIMEIEESTGTLKRTWSPGHGLPSEFALRRPNRGFEALTTTEKGELVAVLQSTTLSNDPKTTPFVLGLKLNPDTGESVTFHYPLKIEFANHGESKIGDIVSLGDDLYLTLHQGKLKDGSHESYLEHLDLARLI